MLRIIRWTWLGIQRADGSVGMIEKCGLLRGRGHRVMRVDCVPNVAAEPLTTFEIEPGALLHAYRLARRKGALELLGYWHTHPEGDAVPSERDAEQAAPDGKLWLVASRTEATLWRSVPNGRLHGRFDPLLFDLRTGKRVDKDVPGVQMRGANSECTIAWRTPLVFR